MPKAELGSSTQILPITPSDTNVLTFAGRFIYVGTAGNINVQAQDDTYSVNIPNVPAGTVLAISPKKVNATSTTASNMVLLL